MKKEMKEMMENGFDFSFENDCVLFGEGVEIEKMKKEELVEGIKGLMVGYGDLKEFSVKLLDLYKNKGGGDSRKDVLLKIMEGGDLFSIKELSEEMSIVCNKEISNKNVSSLLSYFRNDEKSGKLKGSDGSKLYVVNVGDKKMLSRVSFEEMMMGLSGKKDEGEEGVEVVKDDVIVRKGGDKE